MLRMVKEEAEKPEKEAKDQHQKLWEEQQAASKAQREQELATNAFQELDDDMDGVVSVVELQTHPELDTDGDGALKCHPTMSRLRPSLTVRACWAWEGGALPIPASPITCTYHEPVPPAP